MQLSGATVTRQRDSGDSYGLAPLMRAKGEVT
jgi:hypothetical protein